MIKRFPSLPLATLLAMLFAVVFMAVPAESAAGLGKSLLDSGDTDDEEANAPAAPPPRGLPPMPKPPAAKPAEGTGLPPELQLRLRQQRVLDERKRSLEEELEIVSRPVPTEALAQTMEQIRAVEAKEQSRKAAFDADVARLAGTELEDSKAELELRRQIVELEKRRADETAERADKIAALRMRAKELENEIAALPALTPDQRAAMQAALRDQIKAIDDLRKRIDAGESVAFDPDAPPPPLPTPPRTPPTVDFGEDPAKRAAALREKAEALRDEADALVADGAIEAELAPYRDALAKRTNLSPEEAQQLIEDRRDSIEAIRRLRADALLEEASDLDDQAFVAELDTAAPLSAGTRFRLRLTAAADVYQEVTNKQQSPIHIRYRPAAITWTMRAFRWPDMGAVMDGKGGILALESNARRHLDAAKAAKGPSKYRIEYYEKALQVLQAMRRVGEHALMIRRDESVPPMARFDGTAQATWTAVEPSAVPDVPPTRIAARIRGAAFSLENATTAWPESQNAPHIVLVQTSASDQREIERLGADIERIEFDLDDADREFKLQIGAAQDRMRNLIASISSEISRAGTGSGLAGGMYALTINPRPFNWMPLQWDATVTKTGGGRRAPETQTGKAKGTCYPLQVTEETALGKLGIADFVANMKPNYILLLADEQIVNNKVDPEKAFQTGVKVIPTGDRARTRRMSIQSNDGIEVLGEWMGAAHGTVVLGSEGSFSTSLAGGLSSTTTWDHEYTFTWKLEPL